MLTEKQIRAIDAINYRGLELSYFIDSIYCLNPYYRPGNPTVWISWFNEEDFLGNNSNSHLKWMTVDIEGKVENATIYAPSKRVLSDKSKFRKLDILPNIDEDPEDELKRIFGFK